MADLPRVLRTALLVRRAVAALLMICFAVALLVWASTLVSSGNWIGGVIWFLIGAFIVSIEIWLFVTLSRAHRARDQMQIPEPAEPSTPSPH
jgi:uncharacterized membrane protein YczE